MNGADDRPASGGEVKMFEVAFDLNLERPDWPPVSVERLWGEKTAVRLEVRIANIPFFVRGIAMGDLVQVRPDHDRRELVFDRFTSESGHSTVRIVFNREEARSVVESKLEDSGCGWESASGFPHLTAVDIPSSADYRMLREWLMVQVDAGAVGIQEAAISSIHREQLLGSV